MADRRRSPFSCPPGRARKRSELGGNGSYSLGYCYVPIHDDMEIPDPPIGNDRRRRSPDDNRVRVAETGEASSSWR